ncbi:hypothetical protein BDQ17DRAFT_410393 [Cyathus striatus]|nr:hypothetical protein BDQ17DRAFT_410393 [Cyathus striatus]
MSTDPSGSGTTTPFYHHDQHTQPSYPTDQQNYHHNAQPNYQQQSQSPESSYTVTSAAQVRIDYQEQRAPGESPGATARGTSPSTSSEMKQCTVRGCSQMVPIASPNKMCETCRGRHRIYASTKRARRKMEKAVVAARNAEALGLPVPAGITLTTQPGLSQQVNAETQLGWMPQVTPSTIVEGSTDISSQPSASTRTMNAWETAIDPSLTSQTWDDSPVINAASGSTIYPPLQGRQMQLSQPHSSSSELANALTLPTPQSQSQSGTMYEQDKAITVSAETLSPAASTSTNINPYSKYFRTGGHAAQEHDWHLSNSSGVQSTSESSSQSKSSKISCDQSDIQIPSKLSTTQLNLGLPREEEEESNMQSENEDQNYRNHDEIATSDQEVVAAIPPTNVSTSNSTTSVEAQNVIDNENPESPPKYCSVKGCKKVMPGSYGFRMCPECRTRYQKYGRTKRRKWRVERLAFAQELAELRKIEDEKRLARGEKPLSEYPDELREWEQSIAEQPPPAPDSISVSISSTSNTGQLSSNENMSISADDSPAPTSISALRSNAGLSPVTDIAGQALYLADPSGKQVINAGASGEAIYLPSSINSPLSHSPYPQLNNPLLLGSELPLPERMCTVSHCHKVLPGFYRYKRCEQHRLQNRYHSKLKRVREKVEKADGPSEGVEVMPIPAGFEEKQKKVESGKDENDERKKLGRKTDGIDSSEGESSPDTKKARTVCSTAECQNLLLPSLRWRTCELCRATQRKRRTEQRLAERWAPQELAPAPHNQSTHHVPGDESQIVQDNAAGVSDEEKNQPDPEGDADVDMDTENAKLADSINNGPRPGALDERRDPVSATPSTGSPISLPGSTATTATKNLITLSNTDTFRAYQPKTTTSAIGRILAKNPHISVDAFSSLLQPSGTRVCTVITFAVISV